MAWDLALDPGRHDLTGGIVTGADEILQRLKVRLWRHLGEWFLNTSGGLPWYDAGSEATAGQGLLGSRDLRAAELLIRRETLETDGVLRIVRLNAVFTGRAFSLFMEILVEGGALESFTLEYPWQA